MVRRSARLPSLEFRAGGYKTVRTPYFSLKEKENGRKKTRIGVVVNTAVGKTAAKRNFWKRQAKASLLAIKNKDVLMVLFPSVNTLTKKQFRTSVREAIKKQA